MVILFFVYTDKKADHVRVTNNHDFELERNPFCILQN